MVKAATKISSKALWECCQQESIDSSKRHQRLYLLADKLLDVSETSRGRNREIPKRENNFAFCERD